LAYLKGTGRSQSAEKRMKARSNAKYYQRKKDSRLAKAAELEQQVKDGSVTEAQAAAELSKFDIGWYKYRTALQGLQEQLAQDQRDEDQEEVNRLKNKINDLKNRNADHLKALTRQAKLLSMQSMQYIKPGTRESLPSVPTGSTRQDFLRFLSLFLPIDKWTENPLDKEGIKCLRLLLHPDKFKNPNNRLAASELFKEEVLYEWYQNFQESLGRAKKWWDEAGEHERSEFRREWKREREYIIRSLYPVGSVIELHEVIRGAMAGAACN
jgi:hypothetical protein